MIAILITIIIVLLVVVVVIIMIIFIFPPAGILLGLHVHLILGEEVGANGMDQIGRKLIIWSFARWT